MFKPQPSQRSFSRIVQAALLVAAACVTLSAHSFPGMKMYTVQDRKLKLVDVTFDLEDSALVVTGKDKRPESVTIPDSDIARVEYERTAHRRWKTGMLVSGLFFLSKAEQHWLAVFQGEEESLFQLSKKYCTSIIDAFEAMSGKDLKVIVRRGGSRSAAWFSRGVHSIVPVRLTPRSSDYGIGAGRDQSQPLTLVAADPSFGAERPGYRVPFAGNRP